MIKILITSVGSLVGQNILDVLEYQWYNRRPFVNIIGINSIPESPNNFRCDKCYILPKTSSPEYKDRIIDVISSEKPELILNGRDEDTLAIKRILESNPHLKSKVPYGSFASMEIALDKLKTWEFCQKYDLPFAETFSSDQDNNSSSLSDFAEKVGFPMIAKPQQGSASRGVFFIRNKEQLHKASTLKNYIFQEYLGDPASLYCYFDTMDMATPLFAHAPSIFHHSCHTFIYPDARTDQIFISKNSHNSGVTVGFERVYLPELEAITKRYAEAIFSEAGFGPLTVQFRTDKHGKWKAQEINMRTNGNTFPRFLMGQDDLGIIINTLIKDANFPLYTPKEVVSDMIVGKTYQVEVMSKSKLNLLAEKMYYEK